jgi:hypothetical protein
MSPVHGLIEEPVTVVTAFTGDGLDRLGEVEEFAAAVAEALGQEIDNGLRFIGALAAAA